MPDTSRTLTCDVAVIGAGTAGLVAEKHARRAGAKTLLIDPAFAGTTCATVGCMPSKLLIAAAGAAHAVRDAARFGISADPSIDGAAVLRRVRRHRDHFVQGVRDGMAKLPDGTCVKGCARFVTPGVLDIGDGSRIEARAVVLATGAAPALPPPFEAVRDKVLTNETLFDLDDLPRSVGVIGAGAVGLELAQALARLGVEVALFDQGDRLAGLPPRVSEELCRVVSQEFSLHLGQSPEATAVTGGVRLDWEGGSRQFDRLLVAAGRPPNLKALDLDKAGLDLDDKGMPQVNPATLQCGDRAIFMAGDANGIRPLLHEAADEGAVAGTNAARYPDLRKGARKTALAITFCRPEAAVIGDIPSPDDDRFVSACADYADQGRAKVIGKAHGVCVFHAARDSGKLTGAALCLPAGEHLAHLIALAIGRDCSPHDLLEMPYYHPTLEEGLKRALQDLCDGLSDTRPWNRSDESLPGERCGGSGD